MSDTACQNNILKLATELTVAWLANPNTRVLAEEVPIFLARMHSAVASLVSSMPPSDDSEAVPEHVPAVSVRRSLASKDHIVSMIDGKRYRMLKRHLATHGLTPAQYRERYGLKADYPMVAESYAEMRRHYAKKIGLGRKAGEKAPRKSIAAAKAAPAPTATAAPKVATGKRRSSSPRVSRKTAV